MRTIRIARLALAMWALDPRPDRPTRRMPADRRSRRGVRGRRILAVDDEPRVSALISRTLSAEGFTVEAASDGDTGLTMALSGGFDLILLDLRLPGRDGFEVLRGIAEQKPEQRVVVVSALPDREARARCMELGAVDYLTKPFSLAELVTSVRTHLG